MTMPMTLPGISPSVPGRDVSTNQLTDTDRREAGAASRSLYQLQGKGRTKAMTIKEIKELYSGKISGRVTFRTMKFSEPIGKCVLVVSRSYDPYIGRYVEALVQVSSGEDILNGHSRPCDNMDDAADVVGEMLWDMGDELEERFPGYWD